MCGIVGYIGKREAAPVLIDGLSALEYRGYDSAGIALIKAGILTVTKVAGRVDALKRTLAAQGDTKVKVSVGIAHTRWATHGAPSEVNAHPHIDCSGNIAVVHNGIIENYQELRYMLEHEGHKFLSQTDTEVLAHRIEKYFTNDLMTALESALQDVRGSYALAVVSSHDPYTIAVAKQGSPLVIGIGDNGCIIASDASAIVAHTRKVMYLEDGDRALCTGTTVTIKDAMQRIVARKIEEITWTATQAQKSGYAHFMLKEIHEQSAIVRSRIQSVTSNSALQDVAKIIARTRSLTIVACGSAYYASLLGAQYLERLARITVHVALASEYRYGDPVIEQGTALMAVSQSGETADTLAALQLGKQHGAHTIGMVNVVGSTISRVVDTCIYTHAGPEMSVASTKALMSQVVTFLLLGLEIAKHQGHEKVDIGAIEKSLTTLPEAIDTFLHHSAHVVHAIAQTLLAPEHIMYLGRTFHYPIALEGALKLKELSYIHAEGIAAGEMKHGPIALVSQGFPIIALAPGGEVFAKMKSNLQELHARGARIIAITTQGEAHQLQDIAERILEVPLLHPFVQPILSVVPLQRLAYEVAVQKNLDVDKPRNLAKSVTVE